MLLLGIFASLPLFSGPAFGTNFGIKKSVPMQAVVVSSPPAGLRLEWAARSDVSSYELVRENPDGSLPEEHEFQRSNPEQYLYINRFVIPDLKEIQDHGFG